MNLTGMRETAWLSQMLPCRFRLDPVVSGSDCGMTAAQKDPPVWLALASERPSATESSPA